MEDDLGVIKSVWAMGFNRRKFSEAGYLAFAAIVSGSMAIVSQVLLSLSKSTAITSQSIVLALALASMLCGIYCLAIGKRVIASIVSSVAVIFGIGAIGGLFFPLLVVK